MTEVVAALIWDQDKFLICQRPAHKARGLMWEFVGGKVEPGESQEEALIRECQEELDITVRVGSIFTQVIHEYPDIHIRLTLFNCSIADGTPTMLEHNAIDWITPSQIPQFDFCPADKDILAMLMKTDRNQTALSFLGQTVSIVIDRPIGYDHNGIIYPVNYGYLPGILAADGEEQDVYLLGVDHPVSEYIATVIAIVHRKNDVEDKLVAAPLGMRFSKEEIQAAVHFQEQYFDTEILQ